MPNQLAEMVYFNRQLSTCIERLLDLNIGPIQHSLDLRLVDLNVRISPVPAV